MGFGASNRRAVDAKLGAHEGEPAVPGEGSTDKLVRIGKPGAHLLETAQPAGAAGAGPWWKDCRR